MQLTLVDFGATVILSEAKRVPLLMLASQLISFIPLPVETFFGWHIEAEKQIDRIRSTRPTLVSDKSHLQIIFFKKVALRFKTPS